MKPFVNVASPTGNVVFSFRGNPIHDLVGFAVGYREAAKVLAVRFKGNAYADYDGYPVLYLYRHSLELLLKAVVYRGAMLMGLIGKQQPEVPGLFSKHDLRRLLPAVRAIFKAMRWDFEGTPFATFEEFERVIGQVDEIDSGSYAFRYPMKTTGEAHLPHHFVMNVANFGETMDILLGYLEGAADLLDETFQAEAEASYEVQQLLAEYGEA
jgi:hypothetical protein